MPDVKHLTMDALAAGLERIRQSPKDEGPLELIVRRLRAGEREVLVEGELDPVAGLVGDTWRTRGSSRTPDGSPHPDMQLNIMNSRVIALVARNKDRWQLAGDQLFVDMDLSTDNVPPGTRLALGSAIIEITAQPHTGCNRFVARFGPDAGRFVNSPVGRQLQLRGENDVGSIEPYDQYQRCRRCVVVRPGRCGVSPCDGVKGEGDPVQGWATVTLKLVERVRLPTS
jgi:hypothetical protein